MLVYRIVHKSFATLYASGIKGRWNNSGNKVIYAAESIPLAFLENMVRRQGVGFNDDFKIMIIEIPDHISIENISATDLNPTWRNPNDYSQCLPLGEKWFNEGKSLMLKVPSAVMPEAHNYVINTLHPDFQQVVLVEVTSLVPDERIEEILKRYPGN